MAMAIKKYLKFNQTFVTKFKKKSIFIQRVQRSLCKCGMLVTASEDICFFSLLTKPIENNI